MKLFPPKNLILQTLKTHKLLVFGPQITGEIVRVINFNKTEIHSTWTQFKNEPNIQNLNFTTQSDRESET